MPNNKEFYKRHPEKRKAERKAWRIRKAARERAVFAHRLKSLNLEQIHAHSCAICGALEEPVRKHAQDHDHISGQLRGRLCARCNMGLGYFKDSVLLLQTAIEYLQFWSNHASF